MKWLKNNLFDKWIVELAGESIQFPAWLVYKHTLSLKNQHLNSSIGKFILMIFLFSIRKCHILKLLNAKVILLIN